jgi:hypothetical protein
MSLLDQAQSCWQKALSLAEDLARSHSANGYYRHIVADVAYSLASLAYHERRQPAEARRLLQKALEIEEVLSFSLPNVAEYGFYLGNLLRDFRDWFGDTGPLEAVHDRLKRRIAECEKEARPPLQTGRDDRLELYQARHVWVERLLRRYRESSDDRSRASAAGDSCSILPPNEPMLLALAGKYTEAATQAASWAANDDGNGSLAYDAAQTCAGIVKLARGDPSWDATRKQEFVELWSKRAVECLQKAQALKYLSAPSTRWLLSDDRELDPLRGRADFQHLLSLQDGGPKRPN